MKSEIIPYIHDYEYGLIKLNWTGKWKKYKDPYGKEIIFLQHKNKYIPILKFWIHEDDIEFLEKEKTTIYY